MLVPPAATACHEWAAVPGTQQAVLNPAVGATQETSPTSVEPLPTWPLRFMTVLSDSSGSGSSSDLADLGGKGSLGVVVVQVVQPHEVGSHHAAERFVGKDLDDAAQVLGLELGLGRQRAGLGAFEQAWIELADDVGSRVADVEERLGEIGHDIGGAAAGRDDVMDPREVGRVLAQQLGGVVGELDGVERRPALLGGAGGMRTLASEPELGGDPRLARLVAGRVRARRVPVKHGVAIVEEPRADEKRLGAASLLGRAAVVAKRAPKRARLQLLGQRDAGGSRGDAEEVVAATVAGGGARPRFRSGTLSCARPGSASYSPRIAITGLPEPTVAMNAVGIPATPRSI